MHIRQLEFTLLQLTQQVDKLFTSIQFAIQGKLSIELVNPVILHYISRNVSLQLQEGYERIAGTHTGNVHLYYELIKVSVVANANCVHLILHVRLQTAERHYTLFGLIACSRNFRKICSVFCRLYIYWTTTQSTDLLVAYRSKL
jgi:hypothetical protein